MQVKQVEVPQESVNCPGPRRGEATGMDEVNGFTL